MIQQTEPLLTHLNIEPEQTAQASIIWLHGLGADGHDFVSIVPELNLSTMMPVRFIFPHAPNRAVTLNNGLKMRAWYDIHGLTANHPTDEVGIAHSVLAIRQLIEQEIARGIPTQRIVLAGFSQGAAMALITGLTYPAPLAGIIALSGYLPLPQETLKKAQAANKHTPIFIAHGDQDFVVSYDFGKTTYLILKQAHYPVSWHSYPMAHTVCSNEVKDIRRWLEQVLIENKG